MPVKNRIKMGMLLSVLFVIFGIHQYMMPDVSEYPQYNDRPYMIVSANDVKEKYTKISFVDENKTERSKAIILTSEVDSEKGLAVTKKRVHAWNIFFILSLAYIIISVNFIIPTMVNDEEAEND